MNKSNNNEEDIIETQDNGANAVANEFDNANNRQQTKALTSSNELTLQQQILLENFNQKPFMFVPPPLITDITTTQYRQNLSEVIFPYTDHYEMFSSMFDIKTGKEYRFGDVQTIEKPKSTNKCASSPKIKVNNLKFLTYTMYTQMAQILKLFCEFDLNGQKAKNASGVIRHKVEEFYRDANEIKCDYQRIKVIHLLEKEIQYLESQTQSINSKVAKIEKYVLENARTKCMQNGTLFED